MRTKRVKQWIIGIDEVGRGPLAGPLVVAALALPYGICLFDKIRDSKKLSPKKREEYSKLILKTCPCAFASVAPERIDEYGMRYALAGAVKRALIGLKKKYGIGEESRLLLDGALYAPEAYTNHSVIIKGDEQEEAIAAASIVAKVHRDAYMTRLHEKVPQYNFAKHKGYGTREHMEAIAKHGLSIYHRKSFCKKIDRP